LGLTLTARLDQAKPYNRKSQSVNDVSVTPAPDTSYIASPSVNPVISSLPPEQAILEMTPERIYQLFKDNPQFDLAMKMIKSGRITKEQAYQNILAIYQNFPEDKFNKIWDLIQNDLKSA